MGRKSAKAPPEDPSVTAQRQQSVLDLAKLNDQENLRVKQMRSASRGVRAFRALNSSSGGTGASSSAPVGSVASAPAAPAFNYMPGWGINGPA
jgi:hypothetical protein